VRNMLLSKTRDRGIPVARETLSYRYFGLPVKQYNASIRGTYSIERLELHMVERGHIHHRALE